jgi:hypothetical protein
MDQRDLEQHMTILGWLYMVIQPICVIIDYHGRERQGDWP